MTQLEQNLQKSTRTKVAIFHEDTHVADVYVVPDTLDTMLSNAYMQSQNINSAWYINSMVDAHVPYARSTKLTDKFVIDDVSYVAQSENDSSYSNLKWAAANV